jgi:hypothetical protein
MYTLDGFEWMDEWNIAWISVCTIFPKGLVFSGAKNHGHCVQSNGGVMTIELTYFVQILRTCRNVLKDDLCRFKTLFPAVGNITDPRGYIWAVTPGITALSFILSFSTFPGFQASCTPRCGDASCSAQLHGMVRRHGQHNLGFENLYRGTPTIGTARIVDAGYVYRDRNTVAANRRNGNQDVATATDQVTSEWYSYVYWYLGG